MAEIVNLRRHRKRAARDVREAKAAENRVRFGLSSGERKAAKAEAERAARDLDAHRLQAPGKDDPSP